MFCCTLHGHKVIFCNLIYLELWNLTIGIQSPTVLIWPFVNDCPEYMNRTQVKNILLVCFPNIESKLCPGGGTFPPLAHACAVSPVLEPGWHQWANIAFVPILGKNWPSSQTRPPNHTSILWFSVKAKRPLPSRHVITVMWHCPMTRQCQTLPHRLTPPPTHSWTPPGGSCTTMTTTQTWLHKTSRSA